MNRRERRIEGMVLGGMEKVGKDILRIGSTFEHAVPLTTQEQILANEDDLQMLLVNQKQYASAVNFDQAFLTWLRMLKAWGMSEEEIVGMGREFGSGSNVLAIVKDSMPRWQQLAGGDKTRWQLLMVVYNSLIKTPVIYRDELDDFLDQNPEILVGISHLDILDEQWRSQRETLGLIRLQIDFLKRKQRQERRARQTPKKVREVVSRPEQPVPETVPAEETRALMVEPLLVEPFALSDWRVYWTEVKFSDSPNQLVELPTDSREAFHASLEEINTGRKHFQIKTTSVATCIEMWPIPEFRKRAILSRFKWGPSYIRDWSKLVRGPVRIMVKSSEEEKRLVFFAADRDTVYRGVFAGMSS